MSYFVDLSPYSYVPSERLMLNVGWLGRGRPFPRTNDPEPRFVDALKTCLQVETHVMRGYHDCEFCDIKCPIMVESRGESRVLGHGEIHMQAMSGLVFAAPTLIVHYVESHSYAPPQEFIEAVFWLSARLELRPGPLPQTARLGAADIVARTRLPWVESLPQLKPGSDSWFEILRFDSELKALVVTAARTWGWTAPGTAGSDRLNPLQASGGTGALPMLELEPAAAAAKIVDAATSLRLLADDLVLALPIAVLVEAAFATRSGHWIERALRWVEEMPWIFLPVEAMRLAVDDPAVSQNVRHRIRRILSLGTDGATPGD